MAKPNKKEITDDMRRWLTGCKASTSGLIDQEINLVTSLMKNGNWKKLSPESKSKLDYIIAYSITASYKFENIEQGVLWGIVRAIDLYRDTKYANANEVLDAIRDFIVDDLVQSQVKSIKNDLTIVSSESKKFL